MKKNFISILCAGLCLAMSLSFVVAAPVKAADYPVINIEKLMDAAKDAIGNKTNEDFETTWEDTNPTGFVEYLIDAALTQGAREGGYKTEPSNMTKLLEDEALALRFSVGREMEFVPGSIISTKDRCFMVLGKCDDGSLLILTDDPKTGVHLAGTVKNNQEFSKAASYAFGYMIRYCGDWYETFYKDKAYKIPEKEVYTGTLAHWNHLFVEDELNLQELPGGEHVLHYFQTGEVPFYFSEGGLYPNGGGSNPDGTNPDGTNPDGTTPSGDVPDGSDDLKSPPTGDNGAFMVLPMMLLLAGGVFLLRKREIV